jgi:hypothetical protein
MTDKGSHGSPNASVSMSHKAFFAWLRTLSSDPSAFFMTASTPSNMSCRQLVQCERNVLSHQRGVWRREMTDHPSANPADERCHCSGRMTRHCSRPDPKNLCGGHCCRRCGQRRRSRRPFLTRDNCDSRGSWSHNSLTRRNPMSGECHLGGIVSRQAERQCHGLLSQEPPRTPAYPSTSWHHSRTFPCT